CQSLFGRSVDAVVHPATSVKHVIDRHATRKRVRLELQVSETDIVIVQFSRFERWKGHELLLDALGRLKDVPGWRLWLAGGVQKADEIAYAKSLEARSARLGIGSRVQMIGQRRDIPEVLAAGDIHCQPNLGPEPFGLAFVEALAAGLPSVSTSMGGAAEIITPDCGILVPPDSPEILADSLHKLISSPTLRQNLGNQSPARAATLCDPGIILNQLNQLLFSYVSR
ncbi:MAG: glycosyltransferase family 4 protein, partial [bacterium]